MNTATKYSVSDAATLYKKSRATLYKDIKNGVLSRDHDGSIDFSELLRVYGEPFGAKQAKRIDTSSIQNQNTPEYIDKTGRTEKPNRLPKKTVRKSRRS
jgi:hypothetical protein